MSSGIYIISSKVCPEKIYVGSAVDISARWKRHLYELRKGKHHNSKLQNHVKKYGLDDLYLFDIYYYPKEDLISEEQRFLDIFEPVFNINPKAGSRAGSKQTNSTKIKISKRLRGCNPVPAFVRYLRLMGQ